MNALEYKKQLHFNWNKLSGEELAVNLKHYFKLRKAESGNLQISLDDLTLENLQS